jgi:hypothetical protein
VRINLAASKLTTAAGTAGGMAPRAATGLTALLAGLVVIDLAVGELAGADTLVLLTGLGESVVLLQCHVSRVQNKVNGEKCGSLSLKQYGRVETEYNEHIPVGL